MRKLFLISLLACLLACPAFAAVSCTNVINSGSTSTANSYNTASITPVDSTLYLLNVHSTLASGNGGTLPVITYNGTNLTFTQIDTIIEGGAFGTGKAQRGTLFRAMGTSTTAGTITIAFSGISQTSIQWSVTQCTGTDTTGSNGSGAIVQHVTATGNSTASPITKAMGSFGSASNATFGAGFFTNSGLTLTAGTGLTKLSQAIFTFDEFSEWAAGNVTPVAASWTGGSSNTWGVFGIEIAVPSAGGSTPTQPGAFMVGGSL